MYNQNYINTIGEYELEKFLLTGKKLENNKDVDYKLDIKNENMEDIQFYYVFQHYLVKCMHEKKHVMEASKYINAIYQDFQKYPYLFVNSPLLRNNTIEMLFQKENDADIVKGYRNKYYSLTYLNELSNKDNLSEDEKNRYFSILIHNMKNPKVKDLIEKEIKKIIDKNGDIKNYNKIELQFYSQYVANYANEIKDEDVIVFIGENNNLGTRGFQNKGIISLNRIANTNIALFTKTACHETQHFKQYKESHNKVNTEAYEQTAFELFYRYLNTNTYNSYKSNYKYSGIELDAEKMGHYKASVFFTMYNRNDLADLVRENRVNLFDRRYFYNYMVDENGKNIATDTFYVSNFDKIVDKNINVLNQYPVLKEFYNSNGKKRNFIDILKSRKETYIGDRPLYDNYINFGIRNNQLDKIDLKSMQSKEINDYGSFLSSKYRDYALTIKDYLSHEPKVTENYETKRQNVLKSNKTREEMEKELRKISIDELNTRKQIALTTTYQIGLAKRVAEYTLKNYDKFIVSYGKKLNVNQDNYLFNFIYDFRDFKFDDIKNEVLLNTPSVLNSLKELKILTDELIKKYNYYYVYGRLKELPEERLNAPTPYGYSFEEYMLGLSQKLTGHQYLVQDGKEYYIGDIIKNYNPEEYDEGHKKAM